MTTYTKIYLISDIHGKYNVIDNHKQLFTPDTPLFILGDLFDRHFGYSKQLIKFISDNLSDESVNFIIGNHDQMLFYTILENSSENVEDKRELLETLMCALESSVTNTIADIFGEPFADFIYKQLTMIPKSIKNNNYNYNLSALEYYQKINNYIQENHAHLEQQLHYLHNLYNNHHTSIEVKVRSKTILLTHTGESLDPWSNRGLSKTFSINSNFDYTIMGHITFNSINQNIEKLKEPIEYDDIFSSDYSLYSPETIFNLDIIGNFKYISCNRLIMIDDGSCENLITIS